MKKYLIFAIVTALTHLSAYACAGGKVELGPENYLTSDGVYSIENGKTTSIGLAELVENAGVSVWVENNKVKTHHVLYLGSIADKQGVIGSTFMVFDEKTQKSSTYMIRSNYAGKGIFTRGTEKPSSKAIPHEKLKQVLVVGC